MKINNWIFVTGAPRSSSTFVGKILSAPLAVDYIHEPLNPDCGIPGITQRYLYVPPTGAIAAQYHPVLQSIFDYNFSLKTGYYKKDTALRRAIKLVVGSRGPFYLRLAKLNPFHTAAILKDPVGCLSTEFLATHFPIKPVILVRHPVTFVASVRRLAWESDLASLRQQPQLIQDYFSDGDDSLFQTYQDPIVAAAVLWRALNKVLLLQASRHAEWQVLTHEALSRAPLETFRTLYQTLGLPWSTHVERLIIQSTTHHRTEARAGQVQDFKRNSADLFQHRLSMLTPAERKTVYDLTADVAHPFYDEASFAL